MAIPSRFGVSFTVWVLTALTVPAADPPQRFGGLGPHARKVTTANAECQAFFDQGLNFLYAFNHDESLRAFRRATELDPGCAMAWWGLATAPNWPR